MNIVLSGFLKEAIKYPGLAKVRGVLGHRGLTFSTAMHDVVPKSLAGIDRMPHGDAVKAVERHMGGGAAPWASTAAREGKRDMAGMLMSGGVGSLNKIRARAAAGTPKDVGHQVSDIWTEARLRRVYHRHPGNRQLFKQDVK